MPGWAVRSSSQDVRMLLRGQKKVKVLGAKHETLHIKVRCRARFEDSMRKPDFAQNCEELPHESLICQNLSMFFARDQFHIKSTDVPVGEARFSSHNASMLRASARFLTNMCKKGQDLKQRSQGGRLGMVKHPPIC